MLNRLLPAFIISLAIVSVGSAQSLRTGDSLERPFAAGGKVRLELSSGDYTIRAGREDRILVRWEGHKSIDIHELARIDASPTEATVRTDAPSRDSHFVIEVPARSDIYLRVRAGDIRVEGIEGNKDIHMTAGDLNIEVNRRSYSTVRASVTFGDLNSSVLGISKSGFRRSFDWQGSGAYHLKATMFAGDLTLR
jgi:hypothetical protein